MNFQKKLSLTLSCPRGPFLFPPSLATVKTQFAKIGSDGSNLALICYDLLLNRYQIWSIQSFFLAIIVKNSEKNACLGRFYAEYTITASSRGFLCGTCPEPFGLTLFFKMIVGQVPCQAVKRLSSYSPPGKIYDPVLAGHCFFGPRRQPPQQGVSMVHHQYTRKWSDTYRTLQKLPNAKV